VAFNVFQENPNEFVITKGVIHLGKIRERSLATRIRCSWRPSRAYNLLSM